MDLPLPLLGIFRARILTMSNTSGQGVPWADEIQFENFSESIGVAPYSEVLFRQVSAPQSHVGVSTWEQSFNGIAQGALGHVLGCFYKFLHLKSFADPHATPRMAASGMLASMCLGRLGLHVAYQNTSEAGTSDSEWV